MHDMNRREFTLAAASGLAGAGALGPLRDIVRWSAPPQGMHVRHNVYCLNPGGREIASYRKAVTVMQARAATDPTSWAAQAAIHGTTTPIAGMIANQCKHGSRFFLSWHRMFLYYFEKIVRAAAGDPAFALPYWGYTPSGQRDLPLPFRAPAAPANALYVATRSAAVNGGASLFASAVDAGGALAELGFDSFFSPILEGTPHGAVHVAVGGWMGSVPTAAKDPIFWLHHCNIDRLWDVWIASGGGRADPTDAPWLTTSFSFYDETGATVSLTGAAVLDAARQLRYRYAPDACGQGEAHGFDQLALRRHTRRVMEPRFLAWTDSLSRRPERSQPLELAQGPTPLTLGATSTEARLPLNAAAQQALEAFLRDPAAGKRVVVSLEDVRVEGAAAVFYELYVDLPAGARDTVYTSPHYLGNLDFFGEGPLTRRYNLAPVYARLRERKTWSADTVRLTFIPRPFTEGGDPSKLLGGRTQAVVGRVGLRIE
jgi:tyrosinase-like protein/polyphenol oxidase-like protein